MTVHEGVIAVEGEPGDDGTIWEAAAIRLLCARVNAETDAEASLGTDPRGRLTCSVRFDHGRAVASARAARLQRGREAKAERRRAARGETADAPSPSPAAAVDPATTATGGFRARRFEE